MIKKFQFFINSLKRIYDKKIGFIRAVEVCKKSKLFHIHLILVFNDRVPQISKSELEKLWKLGVVSLKNKVNNIYGLIEYITLNVKIVSQPYNKTLSYFPRGAKIIASNIKSFSEVREIEISNDEISNLIAYAQKNNLHIRYDEHYYFENGIKKTVLDGITFIVNKDYIINNFGTKEDDEILKKTHN